MTGNEDLLFEKEAAQLDLRIRELAWQECIAKTEARIHDLESLQAHQDRQGLDSNETRGQIKAFRLVLEWMKNMRHDEGWSSANEGVQKHQL